MGWNSHAGVAIRSRYVDWYPWHGNSKCTFWENWSTGSHYRSLIKPRFVFNSQLCRVDHIHAVEWRCPLSRFYCDCRWSWTAITPISIFGGFHHHAKQNSLLSFLFLHSRTELHRWFIVSLPSLHGSAYSASQSKILAYRFYIWCCNAPSCT